ncbi:MAG: alpha-pyrone synthase [Polyangiales bacterium]|jgi:alpha-pyrone synthase
MTLAHINRIATAVPEHDVHGGFLGYARSLLAGRRVKVFDRLVRRSQIDHRYSVLTASGDPDKGAVDGGGLYERGRFPSTAARMTLYEEHAAPLAEKAIRKLGLSETELAAVTHLVVTSCTGMYAPGLDLDLVARCGLPPSTERTMVGFMGCYAAINGLKLAHHIVRSEPSARVLMVNLELCSLHLQETAEISLMMSFLIFGDGCAASLITADPVGIAVDRFHAALLPDTQRLITWNVGDVGFDMGLSPKVPAAIEAGLPLAQRAILDGAPPDAIDHWAVHPGGRAVLDAVQQGMELEDNALSGSRSVLQDFGNMSSATVMFVLEGVLQRGQEGERGCAMSFGPGLSAETMLFHRAAS